MSRLLRLFLCIVYRYWYLTYCDISEICALCAILSILSASRRKLQDDVNARFCSERSTRMSSEASPVIAIAIGVCQSRWWVGSVCVCGLALMAPDRD